MWHRKGKGIYFPFHAFKHGEETTRTNCHVRWRINSPHEVIKVLDTCKTRVWNLEPKFSFHSTFQPDKNSDLTNLVLCNLIIWTWSLCTLSLIELHLSINERDVASWAACVHFCCLVTSLTHKQSHKDVCAKYLILPC